MHSAGASARQASLQYPPVFEPLRLVVAVKVGLHVGLVPDALVVQVGVRVMVGVSVSLRVVVTEAVGLGEGLWLRVPLGLMLTECDGTTGEEQGSAKHTTSMPCPSDPFMPTIQDEHLAVTP